jgi:hypothetical protein
LLFSISQLSLLASILFPLWLDLPLPNLHLIGHYFFDQKLIMNYELQYLLFHVFFVATPTLVFVFSSAIDYLLPPIALPMHPSPFATM